MLLNIKINVPPIDRQLNKESVKPKEADFHHNKAMVSFHKIIEKLILVPE